MIKLKSLLVLCEEYREDTAIEKFIEALPKYGLRFHLPTIGDDFKPNPEAFSVGGTVYPTVTNANKTVKVALDRTDIFERDGRVWVGSASKQLINGFVMQAIVTDPEHRGRGEARETLKNLLKAADEASLTLKLEVAPIKNFIKRGQKNLTRNQLEKWYAKHGFEKNKNLSIMTRNPKNNL